VAAWEFFRFNVLGGSGQFHASPWWELWAYLALLWIPPLGWLAARKPRESRWPQGVVLGTAAVFTLIRHKELRFALPWLPFTALASVPALGPRARRAAAAGNAVLWAAALLLYTEPHGDLVRALNAAGRVAAEHPGAAVALVGIETGLPEFYLRGDAPVRKLSRGDWQRICSEGAREELVVLVPEPCTAAVPRCQRVAALTESWGHRLRQRISATARLAGVHFGPGGQP
jgi:hypothetical protein